MTSQDDSTPMQMADDMDVNPLKADQTPSSMAYDLGTGTDTSEFSAADWEHVSDVIANAEEDPAKVAFEGYRPKPNEVLQQIQIDLEQIANYLQGLDEYKNMVELLADKHSEKLKESHVVLGTNNRGGNTATVEWRKTTKKKFKRKNPQDYYQPFLEYYDQLRRNIGLPSERSMEIAFVKEVDAINTEQAVFEFIKDGTPTFKDDKSGTYYRLAKTSEICKSMGWRGDSESSPKGPSPDPVASSSNKRTRGNDGQEVVKPLKESQVDEIADKLKEKLDLTAARDMPVEDQIKGCKTKEDFYRMVDTGGPVNEALLRIEGASTRFPGNSIDEFAIDWAKRLSLGNDQYAKDLQKDKNVAMSLVYVACDRCFDAPYNKKKNVEETLSEQDLVDLGTRVVIRILAACLPLNRYDALYRLKLPGNTEPGVHWYSQQDVNQDKTWYAINENYTGKPTINKRLVWLMDIEGLELKKNPAFVAWMKPQLAPSHAV